MKNIPDPIQKSRRHELKKEILNSYAHLAVDEIEILEAEFEKSETRMVEIMDIRSKSAVVIDLFEDIEFSPVVFPETILLLLERHDVFLATIGFRNKKWEVIFLSPPYDSSTI